MANLQGTLETIRSTLPELRKDGKPRRVQLTKREEGLTELLEELIRHVLVRDGNQEVSRNVCRGCSQNRLQVCPTGHAMAMLEAMGRDNELF